MSILSLFLVKFHFMPENTILCLKIFNLSINSPWLLNTLTVLLHMHHLRVLPQLQVCFNSQIDFVRLRSLESVMILYMNSIKLLLKQVTYE